jgi:hypothetical protein
MCGLMAAERDSASLVESVTASPRASTRDGRTPRVWPSLLLVAVFVVGFVLVSLVVLVRGRLLDADLYSAALVRADAYERVYTEVLADPELADLQEQLLGGLGIDETGATQVRTLATSSLRLGVPPSTLRQGTETFIDAVLAYLRGDTARLEADVDVTEVLGRVRESGVPWVHGRLATAGDLSAPTLEAYRAAVDSFADRLAAGAVPETIPVIGGTTIDAAQVLDVILDRLGPDMDPRLREQIRAAVLSGDERDALIEASTQLIAGQAAEATAELRASLEDGHDLDVISELADRAGRSKNAIVGQLNTVRDAARWLSLPTALVGAALMAGSATAIVWLNRRNLRRAGYLLGTAAIVAGLAIVALWTIATSIVGPPFEAATGTGPGTWGLPAGLRSLLADIEATLADALTDTVRRLALVPIASGAALAVGIALAPKLRAPSVRQAVAVGATAAVIVGLVAWVVPARTASSDTRACNGHPELCSRRYDEVVYAATHNVESRRRARVARAGRRHRLAARRRGPALLIDTHHWTPLLSDEQLAGAEPYLPPQVAEPLFARLGPLRQAQDGTFLCHNQCALGAIPLLDALRTVGEFLGENPHEVVTLIIQDAISPAETAEAFGAAGLDAYLHEHESGTPWPTLGDLIDRGERLVVLAENDGPPPAWYHQAFQHMQDTPYRFLQPDDFTCARNRGHPDAPLFLMNHWVSRQNAAPDRATALGVNSHDVIVERARACQRERDLMPNHIAVDFYSLGDVTGAVDTLNAVG